MPRLFLILPCIFTGFVLLFDVSFTFGHVVAVLEIDVSLMCLGDRIEYLIRGRR